MCLGAEVTSMTSQSRWTSLPPVPLDGSGTWLVESLDSYVGRLAATLNMSVLQMLSEIDGMSTVTSGSVTQRRNALVGPSARSSKRRRATEIMTGVDLRGSTFCALKEIMQQRGGISTKRRWCPVCLGNEEGQVTNRLIWCLEDYTACSLHDHRIVSECARCGSEQNYGRSEKSEIFCGNCGFALSQCFQASRSFKGSHWINTNLEQFVEWLATADPEDSPFRLDHVGGRKPRAMHTGCNGELSLISLASDSEDGRISIASAAEIAIESGCSLLDCFIRPLSQHQQFLFEDLPARFTSGRELGTKVVLAILIFSCIVSDERFVAVPPVADFVTWLGLPKSDARHIYTRVSFKEKSEWFVRAIGARHLHRGLFSSAMSYCISTKADGQSALAYLVALYPDNKKSLLLAEIARTCVFISDCIWNSGLCISKADAAEAHYRKWIYSQVNDSHFIPMEQLMAPNKND
ncbi:TniQ family protein [Luteimonas terrae]|uniref:TniQ domain-containing protein n=1 Tax=Luteimonas terrae TaxID=1530191 RepID=A0A4R5U8Y0_9GAMM|nr:hypothetical protein E2F49_11460 [Luteimonas terrae]